MNSQPKPAGKTAKKITWGILILILLGIVAMIVIKKTTPPPEKKQAKEQAIPVAVSKLAPSSIDNTILLPGTLEAFLDIILAIENPGTVMDLTVDKGDAVTNGQLLMKIDSRLFQQALKQAEIDIREARNDLERWEKLHASGAVSKDDFDTYRTTSEYAEIAYINAKINLEKSEIVSPINGFINDRYTDLGEYVNEGAPVFQLLDLKTMTLVVDIPERTIAAIHVGDTLPFTAKALPGKSFTATISFISSKASPASNSFRMEAMVTNPNLDLKAGMIVETQLTIGTFEESIIIPLACIIPDKGDYVVYTIDDNNRAKRTIVKIDSYRGSNVIISSGLTPGEHLVVEGHRSLSDGILTETIDQTSH